MNYDNGLAGTSLGAYPQMESAFAKAAAKQDLRPYSASPPSRRCSYSVDIIQKTAKAFFARERRWPTCHDKLIIDPPLADGKRTWKNVNYATTNGGNGLTAGPSLSKILEPIKQEMAAQHCAQHKIPAPPFSGPRVGGPI